MIVDKVEFLTYFTTCISLSLCCGCVTYCTPNDVYSEIVSYNMQGIDHDYYSRIVPLHYSDNIRLCPLLYHVVKLGSSQVRPPQHVLRNQTRPTEKPIMTINHATQISTLQPGRVSQSKAGT